MYYLLAWLNMKENGNKGIFHGIRYLRVRISCLCTVYNDGPVNTHTHTNCIVCIPHTYCGNYNKDRLNAGAIVVVPNLIPF